MPDHPLPISRREAFERDGFLVIPDFVDAATCEALMARAGELVAGFDPAETRSVFSTTDQERTTDDYFLGSGDRIRFFLEEGAVGPDGTLRVPKDVAVNKIGHALHDLDPAFDAVSRSPKLARLAAELGLRDPRLLQSMYIFKQPRIGGEVVQHQDATFLYTQPVSVTGFWFALQDATVDNGCLWAVPGGHRTALRRRFKREPDGSTSFEVFDAAPFRDVGQVPIEAPAGTLVLLHGLLPHRSGTNRSDRSRHAYSIHLIDGASAYPEDNWLRRGPDLPLRGF